MSILESLQSKMEQLLLSNKEQTKKLDQVLTRMSAVERQVNANRKDLVDLQVSTSAMEKDISEIRTSAEEKASKTSMEHVESKIDEMENRMKRNNLVFWNIPESQEKEFGSCESLIHFILVRHMKVPKADKMVIQRAHRTPPYVQQSGKSSTRPRPIHVLFLNYQDRVRVLKNGKLLKDNPLDGNNIFITDDVSERIRLQRRYLRSKCLADLRHRENVVFAYIPWLVPARVVYKDETGLHSLFYSSAVQ